MPQPKENSPIKRDILFRVHLLYAAFVLIAALVFARLIWVQLFSSEVAYNAERLEGRIFTDEIIPARRGNILTRDGEPAGHVALPLSGRNGLRQPGVRLAPHVP